MENGEFPGFVGGSEARLECKMEEIWILGVWPALSGQA